MKAPHGKIVVSIVGDEDDRLLGLHLLRFDGANASLRLPAEFGADFRAACAGLSRGDKAARILDWTRVRLAQVEFGFGSPLAAWAERGDSDPVVAGERRYFGMGCWGYDVGVIDAGSSEPWARSDADIEGDRGPGRRQAGEGPGKIVVSIADVETDR